MEGRADPILQDPSGYRRKKVKTKAQKLAFKQCQLHHSTTAAKYKHERTCQDKDEDLNDDKSDGEDEDGEMSMV